MKNELKSTQTAFNLGGPLVLIETPTDMTLGHSQWVTHNRPQLSDLLEAS